MKELNDILKEYKIAVNEFYGYVEDEITDLLEDMQIEVEDCEWIDDGMIFECKQQLTSFNIAISYSNRFENFLVKIFNDANGITVSKNFPSLLNVLGFIRNECEQFL